MKTVLGLHFVAALLLLQAELPKHGAQAFPVTCCLKMLDIKVQRDLLKSYHMQDKPLCPIKAVRFVTKKDITFCLDPSSLWAINTMAFLDVKDPAQGNNTESNTASSLGYI